MVDLFHKKGLKRDKKPSFLNILDRSCSKKESHNNTTHQMPLGSGLKSPVFGSILREDDPYTPHISSSHNNTIFFKEQPERPYKNQSLTRGIERHHSSPEFVTHRTKPTFYQQLQQQQQQQQQPLNYTQCQQHFPPYSPSSLHSHNLPSPISPVKRSFTTPYPPHKPLYPLTSNGLSTPPLSPTNMSFAATRRSSTWREMTRSSTYHPAPSISSAEESDDNNNEPLGPLASPVSTNSYSNLHYTSLSGSSTEESTVISTEEDDEEDDDDLVPIAALSICRESGHHMSAAEKYKAKMKAKLQLGSDEDHQYPGQPQAVNPFL
ncbi:hypothetical protein BDF20DRAFT_834118 [Mycotypha africana]|uniref:uncharacterized protein n=1 Tax=Mycotypha africana TaxID=64632 RepID=UPI002300FE6C|nr:uncharacterized protein BDF20DRAFT_834118 [Mycotypha africana]KAI8984626.1 hypothetical protein BDF20DRAFT_834118 [Mycotypha africana]